MAVAGVEGRAAGPPVEKRAGLAALASHVRPVALAGERILPVLEPLVPLLPEGGLRRGSVVTVAGSTSLALAVMAGASAAGSWCAAVGLPSLGVVAAAELGIALERFPLVAAPADGEEWAWAVAAVLDAVDVVLARPPRRVADRVARRLTARARERAAVLLVAGGYWPPGADVRLAVVGTGWEGVGEGHGRLRARRVEVAAGGRGAAACERRVSLWLPDAAGGVAAADPESGAPAARPVGAAGVG